MTPRTLAPGALNRALLARQLLLERAAVPLASAVELIGGADDRPRVFTTRNPFSVGTYLVDGRVAGAWSLRDGQIALEPYEHLANRDRDAVEEERAALEAFHA